MANLSETINFLNSEIRFNFTNYCANPTEQEANRVFSYLVNKILHVDESTPRDTAELCKLVNHFLPKYSTTFKVYYADFLVPGNTIAMAIGVLGAHVMKQVQAESQPNSIIQEKQKINQDILKLEVLEKETQLIKHEYIASNEAMAVTNDKIKLLEEIRQQEERKLDAAHQSYSNAKAKLKKEQDDFELLDSQLHALKIECSTLSSHTVQQNEIYKTISTFAHKDWVLKQLKDELEQLQQKLVAAPVVEPVNDKIKQILEKLNINIDKMLEVYAENDTLKAECFNTKNKLKSVENLILDIIYSVEDQEFDKKQIKEIEALSNEIVADKGDLVKLKKKSLNLYKKMKVMRDSYLELQEIVCNNNQQFHAENEYCANAIERLLNKE